MLARRAGGAPAAPPPLQPSRCRRRLPRSALRAAAAARPSAPPDEEDDGSSPAQPGDDASLAGGRPGPASRLGTLAAQSGLLTRVFGDRPSTDGDINFAQMMEYLANKRVLRLLIYDSGKTAIGARAPSACAAGCSLVALAAAAALS